MALEAPTVLGIVEEISADPVALRNWGMLKNYFVSNPGIREQIQGLLDLHRYEAAFALTLETWIGQVNPHNLADLITILKVRSLNALILNLEKRFEPGPVLLEVAAPHLDPSSAVQAPAPPFGRKSEVDINHNISPDQSVVSILRTPASEHKEHAFITVEGIDQEGHATICFMDLVSKSGQYGMGNHEGEIRVEEYVLEMGEYFKKPPLVYSRQNKSDRHMMNPRRGRRTLARSWVVSARKACAMITRVKGMRLSPPRFVTTGENSILTMTLGVYLTTGSTNAHNCFTWARAQLLSLREEAIQKDFEQLKLKYGSKTLDFFFGGDEAAWAWYTSTFLPQN